MSTNKEQFLRGFRLGLPIGLGYLSVAITFGMMAVSSGLPVWAAVFISLSNLTSAGQFAGLALMVSGGSLFEIALTQLIINIRYSLMSLSISQKLDETATTSKRFLISFATTDEIFAIVSTENDQKSPWFFYGIILLPYFGWCFGTFLGAVASTFLPLIVRNSLGIAIYGMFLAIILPPARHVRSVLYVIILAVILSCVFRWVAFFSFISSGFSIIICTVIAAAYGALCHPIKEEQDA